VRKNHCFPIRGGHGTQAEKGATRVRGTIGGPNRRESKGVEGGLGKMQKNLWGVNKEFFGKVPVQRSHGTSSRQREKPPHHKEPLRMAIVLKQKGKGSGGPSRVSSVGNGN